MLYDVDEEVYEGEVDEASLAREASDADRRAIADAGQAGRLDFMCARKGGYEDLTRTIPRHFVSYGLLNLVICYATKI